MEKRMLVVGEHGIEPAQFFAHMGREPLKQVTLSHGYLIEGKLGHRVKSPLGWVSLEDIKVGDQVFVRGGDRLWNSCDNLSQETLEAYLFKLKSNLVVGGLPRELRTANKEDSEWFLTQLLGETIQCSDEQVLIDLQLMFLNFGWLTDKLNSRLSTTTRISGNVLLSVVSIQDTGIQDTYDINVPGTSTIVTNGIVSHNSDVRFRMTSRVLTSAPLWAKPGKKDNAHEYEPSITGSGKDKYKYVHVKAFKNKLGGWIDEGWVRVWAKDANGIAHGLDPVFDTLLYLRITGQLLGKNRQKLELKLDGWSKAKPVDWMLLKTWILGSKEQKLAINKKLKLEKAIDLRRQCFRQVQSGLAERLLAEQSQLNTDDDE